MIFYWKIADLFCISGMKMIEEDDWSEGKEDSLIYDCSWIFLLVFFLHKLSFLRRYQNLDWFRHLIWTRRCHSALGCTPLAERLARRTPRSATAHVWHTGYCLPRWPAQHTRLPLRSRCNFYRFTPFLRLFRGWFELLCFPRRPSEEGKPGLPHNVAALVHSVSADSVDITLVSTDVMTSSSRTVIIQAGAFREHKFTTATFSTSSASSKMMIFYCNNDDFLLKNDDFMCKNRSASSTVSSAEEGTGATVVSTDEQVIFLSIFDRFPTVFDCFSLCFGWFGPIVTDRPSPWTAPTSR